MGRIALLLKTHQTKEAGRHNHLIIQRRNKGKIPLLFGNLEHSASKQLWGLSSRAYLLLCYNFNKLCYLVSQPKLSFVIAASLSRLNILKLLFMSESPIQRLAE